MVRYSSGCEAALLLGVAGTGAMGKRKSMRMWSGWLWVLAFVAAAHWAGVGALGQSPLVLARDGGFISLEPFAANVVRVTISSDRDAVTAAPGYGVVGRAAAAGWTHDKDGSGYDVYRSGRMVVRLAPADLAAAKRPKAMPLDAENNRLREIYFGGGGGGVRTTHDAAMTVADASGKVLVSQRSWTMAPESGEVAQAEAGVKGYTVGARFDSRAEEHYYGLGQQQQGWMDLRDREVHCWHDYNALGGENVCVPLLVSSLGYGLLWDNPSKTTVKLGFNGQTTWSSEVGDRVSYFVIAGETSDEIYGGYRLLTGVTHLLPKAAYGYIQSKAIYPTQDQVLAVAKEYRAKQLPLDVMVVDFLNMTRQGEMDLDPARWPDAAAMNRELHAMGVETMLSVWPHFAIGTQFYDMLLSKGWLIHKRDGTPDQGGYKTVIGPNLDTTNPEAARWFWEKIRDRYVKPFGFDAIWLDETEPDVDPAKDVFFVGSGTRYYNVYPLFHTAAVYDGYRRDFGESRRVLILARAAYLGAQRNGTVMWSSDIVATWDMLKRSVPAGLNFAASGFAYWDTDIAGFFSPQVAADYHAAHKPLVDGSDVRGTIGNYEDYPELFVRWFEYGAFQPVMRAHGERDHNEVWAYGKQAEPILAKYLRLRYELLPYTYSAAYGSYRTGAPYMRALFMDFSKDAEAANVPDEYMYGPAFLVAPVTEQGATSRRVYLPAGTDWYNYWTNERLHGGQTIVVSAPIETLPLFVRAGSILPLGSAVLSTSQVQTIGTVKVYRGANGALALFQDDGKTYGYEDGKGKVTAMKWDDAAGRLMMEGKPVRRGPDGAAIEVVGQ